MEAEELSSTKNNSCTSKAKSYKASVDEVLHFLKSGRRAPPSFDNLDKVTKKKRVHTLSEYSRNFVYEDNTLYYQPKRSKKSEGQSNKVKVLFTREEIERVLRDLHSNGTNGSHMGEKRTQTNIAERFYWRTMTYDVRHWITTCPGCKKVQKVQKFKKLLPELKQINARQPWQLLGIYVMGPFKQTSTGFKYILTGTCLFSKWVEAEPITDMSADCVYQGLTKWIFRWGVPQKIFSDQGKGFNKKLNNRIFGYFKLKHLVTAAYHPQTYGQDERTKDTIKNHLTKMVNEQQHDWHLYIEQACWGLRSSYNESTKMTPYEVMMIRKPRFPSELPAEDDYTSVCLQEPTPDEVAAYVHSKQAELLKLEETVNVNNVKAKEKQASTSQEHD